MPSIHSSRLRLVVRGPVDGRVRQQPGLPLGELEHVAGRQALDAPEERPVAGDVADVHRQVQARLVELGRDEAAGEHRLGFGPEGQHAVPVEYTSGFTPSGSRTRKSLRRARSNRAKAKIPLSRAAKPIPSSS